MYIVAGRWSVWRIFALVGKANSNRKLETTSKGDRYARYTPHPTIFCYSLSFVKKIYAEIVFPGAFQYSLAHTVQARIQISSVEIISNCLIEKVQDGF